MSTTPFEGCAEVVDLASRRAQKPPAIPEVPDFIDHVQDSLLSRRAIEYFQVTYGMVSDAIDVINDKLSFTDSAPDIEIKPPLATHTVKVLKSDETLVVVSKPFPRILQQVAGIKLEDAITLAADATAIHGMVASQMRARAQVRQRTLEGSSPADGFDRRFWPLNFAQTDGSPALFYRFAATSALRMWDLKLDALSKRIDHKNPMGADVAGFANPAPSVLARDVAVKYLK